MTGNEILSAFREGSFDEALTNAFCDGCPAKWVDRGATEYGLPIEPDEERCPADMDFADVGCIKSDLYKKVMEGAEMIASVLRGAGI